MVKNILLFVLCLLVVITSSAQVLDTLPKNDSIIVGSHIGFSSIIQEEDMTKAKGDSAYMKSDYASAIQIYEALLKEGEAAEIYYNLGNSYYKTNNIAKAILNYERALLLKPNNDDIRVNIEIARAKTIDKVIPIPEIFFISWAKWLINCLSIDAWAKVGISCFFLVLVSLYFFFFSKQILWKKIGFIVGVIFLVLVIFANIFAFQQKNKLLNRNIAIIVSPSVIVRSTPSESGTSLFVLHEGRKVEIRDNSMLEWKEICLEDGKVGWILASSIEII